MKVLITGATGFIGGAIAREAQARGFAVTALHRHKVAPTEPAGVAWRTLEELEAEAASPGGEGRGRWDLVIHAAALRHRHGVPPTEYLANNSALTERVVGLARGRTERLVYVSSIAVYGWPHQLPIDESFPHAPVGPYGESKIHCERLVRSSGVPFTIVQPSITYGPGDTNGMMDKLLRMVARRRFVVPGLGSTRVQLVYVDDLARLTVDAGLAERTQGETFICTYRDPIRVRDLVRLTSRAVGTWVPPIGPPTPLIRLGAIALEGVERLGLFGGAEPPVTREKLATISVDRAYRIDRMRTLLGTEPQVGYAEGFTRTARALGL